MKSFRLARVRALLKSFTVILGVSLGFAVLLIANSERETVFEDAALGEGTTSAYLKNDKQAIHCSDERDLNECVSGFVDGDRQSAGLWLGNSMLHAINQYREGEPTSPLLLHRSLAKENLDLLTFSQPNANLQEHLVLFEHLSNLIDIELLIVPVVFDDLREDGIRKGLAGLLTDTKTVDALMLSKIGQDIVGRSASTTGVDQSDIAGVSGTVQEHSEQALNEFLASHSELWSKRKEYRGRIFLSLYRLRNSLLGIDPSSIRRLIPVRYDRNIAALKEMLRRAKFHDSKVLVYIPPIRHDAELPYDEVEYQYFKGELQELAKEYNVAMVDLEHAVPDEYWGVKSATNSSSGVELDFMHFQSAGHESLAASIEESLRELKVIGEGS